MASFFTYDQVGIKEDISDVISNISPTKTPFQALLKSESINNTLFQWQEDSLASAGANAKVEGADAVDTALTATTMRSNRTQILSKTVNIAATADVVSTYGRAKETAYQISKKSAELKRDLEYAMVGVAQNAAVGSSSVARTFGNAFGTDGTTAIIVAGNSVAAGTAALTETHVLTANQALYTAGAEATVIMIKPADSLIFANFAAASGRNRTFDGALDKKIVNVVDLYVSPFGEQRVVLNRFILATGALIYDPANWKLCTLRPWTRELLAKTGDADRHMLIGEFSLKHLNYSASAKITGLT